jgi:2-dehydro-3-deoxygalactonokinase
MSVTPHALPPSPHRTHRVLIDGGTTNTRAWAVEGRTVLAEARAMIGARDSAREGASVRLAETVRDLVAQVSAVALAQVHHWQPECVIAAGMITSPLGLAEVPHQPAPVGIEDLARHTLRLRLPYVTPLPLLLVPGVRCGPLQADHTSISQIDVMRGEETLCIGLIETGAVQPPAMVLSLGSHWKLCEIDSAGRIAGSMTTLSGELLHVLRTQTVLAATVEATMPERFDLHALRLGMQQRQQEGLLRALFCSRLLERVPGSSPHTRLSFLVGTIVGETLAHWRDRVDGHTVALSGSSALCEAWSDALAQIGVRGRAVSEEVVTAGFIAGLSSVADRCPIPSHE